LDGVAQTLNAVVLITAKMSTVKMSRMSIFAQSCSKRGSQPENAIKMIVNTLIQRKFTRLKKLSQRFVAKKKPQELTDEEFEAMAAQNVVKPIATTNKKEVDKKTGGRFAALDDSPVEKQESTADDSTSEEIQRFAMTTPVNVPVDIPEVSAEKRIVLTAENYKEQQPLLASLTWEQVEAIAKQVGAITVDEKQPIRVVKPKAVVDEFPSLGSAPVKKQSTGQWGAQNAVQRNAKWGEIAKEKAAREAEEKKRAEEKAQRVKEALRAKEKAEKAAAALYAANLLDSDDEYDSPPEDNAQETEAWWN
jgi:hypothetical protein